MTHDLALAYRAPARRAVMPAVADATFVELVCADSDWLQVEFEAIIAANFPPGDGQRSRRPPRRPAVLVTDQPRQATSASRPAVVCGPVWTQPGAAQRDRARERGPPTTDVTPHQTQRP
jgi:hypothetical protein